MQFTQPPSIRDTLPALALALGAIGVMVSLQSAGATEIGLPQVEIISGTPLPGLGQAPPIPSPWRKTFI